MSAFSITGTCSTFGGPDDTGVSPSEELALYERQDVSTAPKGLFLERQPQGTTGTARRLNPKAYYVAMRWAYKDSDRSTVKPGLGVCLPVTTPRAWLKRNPVTVSANGHSVKAWAVDWGPNSRTGRIVDMSPGLAEALEVRTDQKVTVEILPVL